MTNQAFHDPLDNLSAAPLPQPDPSIYGTRVHNQQGKITRCNMLTYDTCELVVQCDPKTDMLRPSAGQYAILKVEELSMPRSFSFARAPAKEKPGEHTFFIRNVPGGLFSEWLFGDKDRVGETLTIGGPMGQFGLDDSKRPIVCIAGGSGMSAIFALLEQAQINKVKRDVVFLYGARTQKDLYMMDEIAKIGKAWSKGAKFEFAPVLSEEPDDSDWSGARGLVTTHLAENYIGNGDMQTDNLIAYFCGPPPMIDAGVEVLKGIGVSEADIRYDKFEDARSPAPVVDNSRCVLCDECLLAKPQSNCIVEVSSLSGSGDKATYQRVEPAKTSGLYYNSLYVDESECIRCYACVDVCPTGAIAPGNDAQPKTLRNIVS